MGAEPTYETFTVERDQGVWVVTINRPERRNAINLTVQNELCAALDAIAGDWSAHALIVTGARRQGVRGGC
ncbi:enoyl-CoA hydratase-related protein [Mycobacterium sp. NPDC003449]